MYIIFLLNIGLIKFPITKIIYTYKYGVSGAKGDGISGSLIWSKTLMELIFNSCGEVRRARLAKSNLLTSTLHWCPWDLLRSFKVCSDAKERVGCGKQREATTPIQSLLKLQPWFLSLRWKTCLWTEVQSWFLRLQ